MKTAVSKFAVIALVLITAPVFAGCGGSGTDAVVKISVPKVTNPTYEIPCKNQKPCQIKIEVK